MKHAEELRAARARKKLSQRELALAIGLTQQMISAWENGEPVAQEHWGTIKDVLGVDLSLISDSSRKANTITGNQQIAVQDCRTVTEILGNTPEQCMRAYLHVRTEQKRNAVDKL